MARRRGCPTDRSRRRVPRTRSSVAGSTAEAAVAVSLPSPAGSDALFVGVPAYSGSRIVPAHSDPVAGLTGAWQLPLPPAFVDGEVVRAHARSFVGLDSFAASVRRFAGPLRDLPEKVGCSDCAPDSACRCHDRTTDAVDGSAAAALERASHRQ